jgi:transcriptional regulator with XRE-family HTH domain
MNFALNLREARKKAGLSQAQLGKLCGMSASHISHFESGRRVASLDNFVRLCHGLNVNSCVLLGLCFKDEGILGPD